jgi:outer membrane biosynthesis protein TonB
VKRKQLTTPGNQRRVHEFAVMEVTLMRALRMISTTALLLLLGVALPAFAQEEHHEQEAKAPKQEQQAKPEKQQQEAKPAKQEHQQEAKGQQEQQQKQQQTDKSAKQEHQQQAKGQQEQQQKQQQQAKTQQNQEKNQQHQQQANSQQHEQGQRQWAHNGQKDSRGHEYNENRFGREHHARFEEHGGRYYNGRREYSYGGYWFYAAAYPTWFYQQDVYFIMGADGLWYAVAYNNPSLIFQVNIG